jgi:hypothetical protein
MKKFVAFLTSAVFSVASVASNLEKEMKNLFPTDEVDFFLTKETFFDGGHGKFFVQNVQIIPEGHHLYKMILKLRRPKKVKKKRILGIKVEVITEGREEKTFSIPFWYRGGRFLVIKTSRGIVGIDFSPKCYFLNENGKWIPRYNTISRDIDLPAEGGRLHLVFSFTRCGF